MYIFPTKALAQDQGSALRKLVQSVEDHGGGFIQVGTLDGDTLNGDRKLVLDQASIVLTNPDMLSATLLPRHEEYGRIFSRLKYVVVDEAHVYRGAFGCHVSCVFRRLLRVCQMYGADPQFICCSATINNPYEHFHMLVPSVLEQHSSSSSTSSSTSPKGTKREVEVLNSTYDGSPKGKREFVIWNPPFKKDAATKAKEKKEQEEKNIKENKDKEQNGIKTKQETDTPSTPTPPTPTPAIIKLTSSHSSASSSSSSTSSSSETTITTSTTTIDPSSTHPHHHPTTNNNTTKTTSHLSSPERKKKNIIARAIRLQRLSTDHPLARKSSIYECATLLVTLVLSELRTIVFVRVRKLVELVTKYARSMLLASSKPELAERLCSYRGGYTPSHRRELESKIFNGEMLGTVATNALELGIDVGTLDVVVMLGFPGTISSMWQQSGRSGRGTREALSMMICWDSPIDQYFARKPSELFSKLPESSVLDPYNVHVLKEHLPAAAKELPLNDYTDSRLFGGDGSVGVGDDDATVTSSSTSSSNSSKTSSMTSTTTTANAYHQVVRTLYRERILIRPTLKEDGHGGDRYIPHPFYEHPASDIHLRSIDDVTISVCVENTDVVIDTIEQFRSYWEVHPGAIYINQGVNYVVLDLNLNSHQAVR